MKKYLRFDRKLFSWLEQTKTGITTHLAIQALGISKDKTKQRHVSRRFSQLEERGVLRCDRYGTTRICEVVKPMPEEVFKLGWKAKYSQPGFGYRPEPPPEVPAVAIPATNSEEFEAQGGIIQRIPSHWNVARVGSHPTGDSYSYDE